MTFTDLQPTFKQAVRDALRTGLKFAICAAIGAALATAAFVWLNGWPSKTPAPTAVTAPLVDNSLAIAPVYASPAGLTPATIVHPAPAQ